jgi:hypothetical protein
MSDLQSLFNLLAGVCGAAGGWWLNTVWKSVTELQRQDRELTEKLSRVEVLVAGDYVRKDEFAHRMDVMESRLSKKLDHIDDKLEHKADKQ